MQCGGGRPWRATTSTRPAPESTEPLTTTTTSTTSTTAPTTTTTRTIVPATVVVKPPAPAGAGPVVPADADGPYAVASVVDGDTVKIVVAGHTTTLRLIGIDTPETKDPRRPVECYGREASAQAGRLLTGHAVKVTFDSSQGRLDKYGRTWPTCGCPAASRSSG